MKLITSSLRVCEDFHFCAIVILKFHLNAMCEVPGRFYAHFRPTRIHKYSFNIHFDIASTESCYICLESNIWIAKDKEETDETNFFFYNLRASTIWCFNLVDISFPAERNHLIKSTRQ